MQGLSFAHANTVPQQPGDAGGIQHDWARLARGNSMLTLASVADVHVTACVFSSGAGGGVRLDGFAKNVVTTNSTFANLGYEAVGVYGLGLGTTQVRNGFLNVTAFERNHDTFFRRHEFVKKNDCLPRQARDDHQDNCANVMTISNWVVAPFPQVTSNNVFQGNDISQTSRVKFDSPAIVLWNAVRQQSETRKI
jgi:hypothetical protein